jgi:hypothetical protein
MLSTFRKAVAAGILALVSTAVGSWTAGHVSWGQVWAAIGAGIVAGVAVYNVTNTPAASQKAS